jgi:ribulose-5-phosphate 4-epimerase/fuculose-1-phosphate aldolase
MIDFDGLHLMAENIGRDIKLIQGAGGNVSSKDEHQMAIKASGFTLDEMSRSRGYVVLNHNRVAKFYSEGGTSEQEARKVISSSVTDKLPSMQPSIETGFHSFLGRYVLHTHPIFLIILSVLKNPEKRLGLEQFGEASVIKYFKPGHELSRQVYEEFRKGKNVFILRNHGLIVSGDDPQHCIEETKRMSLLAEEIVNEHTSIRFENYRLPDPHRLGDKEGFLGTSIKGTKGYVFPDAVVFLEDINKKRKIGDLNGRAFYPTSFNSARSIDEVLHAHNQVIRIAPKLGDIGYLSEEDVNSLLNMQEEKHRKRKVVE